MGAVVNKNYVRIDRLGGEGNIIGYSAIVDRKPESCYSIILEGDNVFSIYQMRSWGEENPNLIIQIKGRRRAERWALKAAKDTVANLGGIRGRWQWSRRMRVCVIDPYEDEILDVIARNMRRGFAGLVDLAREDYEL